MLLLLFGLLVELSNALAMSVSALSEPNDTFAAPTVLASCLIVAMVLLTAVEFYTGRFEKEADMWGMGVTS